MMLSEQLKSLCISATWWLHFNHQHSASWWSDWNKWKLVRKEKVLCAQHGAVYHIPLSKSNARPNCDTKYWSITKQLTCHTHTKTTTKKTDLGPPLIVGQTCSVQFSQTVPYRRLMRLKKSTTETKTQVLKKQTFGLSEQTPSLMYAFKTQDGMMEESHHQNK